VFAGTFFETASPAVTMAFSPIVTPYVSVMVVGDFFLLLLSLKIYCKDNSASTLNGKENQTNT
jgi:hypothetical protein